MRPLRYEPVHLRRALAEFQSAPEGKLAFDAERLERILHKLQTAPRDERGTLVGRGLANREIRVLFGHFTDLDEDTQRQVLHDIHACWRAREGNARGQTRQPVISTMHSAVEAYRQASDHALLGRLLGGWLVERPNVVPSSLERWKRLGEAIRFGGTAAAIAEVVISEGLPFETVTLRWGVQHQHRLWGEVAREFIARVRAEECASRYRPELLALGTDDGTDRQIRADALGALIEAEKDASPLEWDERPFRMIIKLLKDPRPKPPSTRPPQPWATCKVPKPILDRVVKWLNRRQLRAFFEKENFEASREAFWLRYLDRMSNARAVMHGHYPVVYLMHIPPYIVVEFPGHARRGPVAMGAAYVYQQDDTPFKWDDNRRDASHYRDPQETQCMYRRPHAGPWQQRLAGWLARHGITPRAG